MPALWACFLAVHAVLGVINITSPTNPFGDVTVVYHEWVAGVFAGRIPAIDVEWVYPVLAIAPMLAAAGIASAIAPVFDPSIADGVVFGVGWLVVVATVTAPLLAWLAWTPRRREAAWWLLALTAALGPISTGRIDAITLPIAVAGMALLRHRPAVAGMVLAIGAWVKIWPGAIFLAALAGRGNRLFLIGGGAIVTGAILTAASLAGGWPAVTSFVTEQTGRGLQIESIAATIPMVFAAAGDQRFAAGYDTEILTVQITGPGMDLLATATTPVMLLAIAVTGALGLLARRAGASMTRIVPPLALALVLVLILTNKVGSPQFVVWVIAVVVAWLAWDPRRARVSAVVTLAIAAATQLIYPWNYPLVMSPSAFGVGLLLCRNLLYVSLFALTVWELVRVWRSARSRLRAAEHGPDRVTDVVEF
ncbi:hypothetical protein GCM10011490_06460 [Pseudoclavibacter endophyticus]|nr:hypothetical protein GCM10011490_06460 [Pseudoclavibacter endophyticus]